MNASKPHHPSSDQRTSGEVRKRFAQRGSTVLSPWHSYLFTVLPTLVAQTCSLLYRRFVTCGSSAKSGVLE